MFNQEKESRWSFSLALVLLISVIPYGVGLFSPPNLMDGLDAAQAQIARSMLASGDWVTPRIDGVAYFEKSPLLYWLMALAYQVFGLHDWAARVPIALSAIALAWITAAFGCWAFGRQAGFYAGLVIGTCVGLWMFTRVLAPEPLLAFLVALFFWAFLRILDNQLEGAEKHRALWVCILYVSLALCFLVEGVAGVLLPMATSVLYLLFARQFFVKATWTRVRPFTGALILAAIAMPWPVLATVRNPPSFSWNLRATAGHYHGFFWFYFIHGQVLHLLQAFPTRSLQQSGRFWLLHLLWLCPWSVYLPAVATLSFKPVDRAGRARLLALCWIGLGLLFYTFTTMQRAASLPCYAAIALLLGSALAKEGAWVRGCTRVLTALSAVGVIAACVLLFKVRNQIPSSDITAALTSRAAISTTPLGRLQDLSMDALAYLRLPLAIAAVAFMLGALGTAWLKGEHALHRVHMATVWMMLLLLQAARMAIVRFDPLLSSRDDAQIINQSPPGQLVIDRQYARFSSVAFYTGRPALLFDQHSEEFAYGSLAPGAPDIFVDEQKLAALWAGPQRYYLVAGTDQLLRFDDLLGRGSFQVMHAGNGKMLITNAPALAH